MSQKKITIHDVAHHANVSVSTVSLVLSGKGRISKTTIERVNQSIESLGYSRNRQAAMLRGGQSGIIGLIIRDIADPFYAEVTSGISDTLEQHGKVLFLTQSGSNGRNLQKCFESLGEQGVDGLIIGDGKEEVGSLKHLAEALNLPIVCAARSSGLAGVDVIRPDNTQAAKLATELLAQQGHRQIAYLGGKSSSLTRAERLGGFCATLIQYGIPFRDDWIIECASSHSAAANAVEQLLMSFPKISAIICDNPTITLGAYFGALRTGRAISHEPLDNYFEQYVSLIGFGDAPEAKMSEPPLSFVNTSAKEIGRHAAERLIQRLSDPALPTQHIILPPHLIK
jgi:LacI family transcriptional regulator of maltose regulon